MNWLPSFMDELFKIAQEIPWEQNFAFDQATPAPFPENIEENPAMPKFKKMVGTGVKVGRVGLGVLDKITRTNPIPYRLEGAIPKSMV